MMRLRLKLEVVRERVTIAPLLHLTNLDDEDLIEEYHRDRLSDNDRTLLQIGTNLVDTIKELPTTSTTRTSLIKATSVGMHR